MKDQNFEQTIHLKGLCLSSANRCVLVIPDAYTTVPVMNCLADKAIAYKALSLQEYLNQQRYALGAVETWHVHRHDVDRWLKQIASVFGKAVVNPATGRID